ncbi:MAG TPA: lysophospholipid acyltransferase family protein [Thermoanaerobaculia bacterium]|nr:lysophospholipid acyltransferase family protein [Thermoanaerobaculia bacterium]
MLRSLWAALVAVSVSIAAGTGVLIVATFSTKSPLIDSLTRWWARTILRAAGVDLHTEGMEKVDPQKRYVLVSNHYSYFDIPCILVAVPQPIRFMAKASLFKIPIFGWALGRAGFIPIDRKNRRTAVKSFDLAAERIRKGNTIVIFPEEGRSRSREMRPFQRGAFLLAIKAQMPMMPIAIDGTFDVFRVGAKRITPGKVTVKAGEMIDCAGTMLRDKERLATESRAQIENLVGVFGESESRRSE